MVIITSSAEDIKEKNTIHNAYHDIHCNIIRTRQRLECLGQYHNSPVEDNEKRTLSMLCRLIWFPGSPHMLTKN